MREEEIGGKREVRERTERRRGGKEVREEEIGGNGEVKERREGGRKI